MKALPGKRSGFQKFIGNLRKFAGAIIPGSGVYIAETQKEIHEDANENNRYLQERREAIQLKQMELSALQYHDNKIFQAEMAQARHQQNLELERSRQAANERLAELNYQRNIELQKANQAFQVQLAQLNHENQQKLQQYRAMLELAIQDKNIDFQKWRLEQEKALQLEIISLRQEFDRELAKYNRETALNNLREQWRKANSPINLSKSAQ